MRWSKIPERSRKVPGSPLADTNGAERRLEAKTVISPSLGAPLTLQQAALRAHQPEGGWSPL